MKLIPNFKLIIFVSTVIIVFCFSSSFSQTIDTALYRKDELGSRLFKKSTVLDGNNIRSLINNSGMIGEWPYTPSIEWPINSGINYFGGITLVVGTKIKASGATSEITPVEGYFYEFMDETSTIPNSTVRNEPWGFNSVPNYSSNTSDIARSDKKSSLPSKWPSALGYDSTANGKWISKLSAFSVNPSLETFFVMDDSKDAEFTRFISPVKGAFFPLKNHSTPNPPDPNYDNTKWWNPTIRKGLGIRVETSTLQWNTPNLKNALFVINEIYNLSDTTYDKPVVGLYLFPNIGGSDNDDNAIWNSSEKFIEISDNNNSIPGRPDITLGKCGIVLLETPGNSNNGIDDDKDGIIDESQSNGLDDDNDWTVANDFGIDGIQNTFDEGESDGMPTVGEPNFEASDPDESDMVGTKSVYIEKVADLSPNSLWLKNDDFLYDKLNSGIINSELKNNLIHAVIGSSSFSFGVQTKFKFSYAIVFGQSSSELITNIQKAKTAYSDAFSINSVGVGVKDNQILPDKMQLNQNYPNPFNPNTTLSFNLPIAAEVSLKVYDLLGREIQTLQSGRLDAGTHHYNFNGLLLTSGIYFIKLVSGNYTETKKMVLMK